MTLPRVLVPARDLVPGRRLVPAESTLWYLRHVLRLGTGSPVLVVDGCGRAWTAELAEGAAGPELAIRELDPEARVVASTARIELVMALLKGDRTELAVQKATELGVHAVHVVVCDRSVPRPEIAERSRKAERMERVALDAARQCGRADVPRVTLDGSLQDVVGRLESGMTRLVLDERAGARPLGALLADLPGPSGGVVLAIGPEGAHSDRERALLEASGFLGVGLGPRVLKAETAAIAAVVICQAVLGDMGDLHDG